MMCLMKSMDVIEGLGREVTTPETLQSHKPYKALEQLLIVFPPQSHYLIPIGGLDAKIKALYISHMFPEKFPMDYMFKRNYVSFRTVLNLCWD